ncbi:hypothetical protein RB195_002154 [Necator americanus]|uniref:Chromo domain-containing protein n=1 Tax=Necator americanus TaxID=51031 RepID=A0ABR1DHM0_NECAM
MRLIEAKNQEGNVSQTEKVFKLYWTRRHPAGNIRFSQCCCSIVIRELDSDSHIGDTSDMAPHVERVRYLVEKILDTRKVKGEREYLILWQDYSIEEASWEKARHCECPDAIAAFYKERRAARFNKPYSRSAITTYTLRKKEEPPRPRVHRTRSSTNIEDGGRNVEITSEDQGEAAFHLYQIQSGRKIEALLGIKIKRSEIQYMVRYRGREPKDKRTEFVPSQVLRLYAVEDFVDCLEQLALANCEGMML